MTHLKNLPAGVLATGIFAMVCTHAGVIVQAPQQSPASPAPVAAPPPQSPAAPTSAGAVVIKFRLELLDKDRDGFVSRDEAAGVPDLLKVFEALDKSRDGKLDRAELDAYSK